MKPKNFPGRKYQRRRAAANRDPALAFETGPTAANEIAVLMTVRGIRTKKQRGTAKP